MRDTAYLSHRVQFVNARPTGGQTRRMTLRPGDIPARDTVEVLTFLTAPAKVTATIGGRATTYDAPAGMSAKLFPLAVGSHAATVSRNGTQTARVATTSAVRASVAVQDLMYYFATSGRP